jgi:2'-5' RNA ligase
MVALFPTETAWCHIKIPHVTIIYLEDVDSLESDVFYEISKKVSDLALVTKVFSEKVTGIEVFGEDERVEVLRLNKGPRLLEFKNLLTIWDFGSFPDFKPHATIGPIGSSDQNPPLILTFDRIAIGWGDDYFVFRFIS